MRTSIIVFHRKYDESTAKRPNGETNENLLSSTTTLTMTMTTVTKETNKVWCVKIVKKPYVELRIVIRKYLLVIPLNSLTIQRQSFIPPNYIEWAVLPSWLFHARSLQLRHSTANWISRLHSHTCVDHQATSMEQPHRQLEMDRGSDLWRSNIFFVSELAPWERGPG